MDRKFPSDTMAEKSNVAGESTLSGRAAPGDFGWALHMLTQGKKIFRQGWNGKGMYLSLQQPDAHSKMSRPYIYIRTADNQLVPWVAAQGDLLSYDWLVIRE